MDQLFDVLTVASLLLIGVVLVSVRREHIRVEYSVSWLLAGLALLTFSRWRGLDERVAMILGTPNLMVAVLTICGGVFLGVLFAYSLRISQLKDSSIKVAQRVAILEFRLRSFVEENETVLALRKDE